MIIVSNAFLEAMNLQRDFRCAARVTFADGTSIDLADEDFSATGNALTDGAGADGLPLGLAVGRAIEMELVNDEGQMDAYSFAGATVDFSLVFNEETVPLGSFTVVEPETEGSTVMVTANDGMYLADKAYDSALSYPATLGEIFADACDRCGIPYASDVFNNSDFTILVRPTNVTYRQVIGAVAMLAGGNARINREGNAEILTYDFSSAPSHTLEDWFSLSVGTEDITITGISAARSQYVDGEVVTSQLVVGEEGYVIKLESPLLEGKETEALEALRNVFVGRSFRIFSGEHLAYPLAEFMDSVSVVDIDGEEHFSVVTDARFAFFGPTDLSNSASPAARVNGTYQVDNRKEQVDGLIQTLVSRIEKTEEGLLLEAGERKNLASVAITKDQMTVAITTAIDGIDSVTTKTGYTFGADGLRIQGDGDPIENKITNTGLYVSRYDEPVLTANNDGVNALNITVRKYLIIGENSRFEEFVDDDGKDGTACFWIGG